MYGGIPVNSGVKLGCILVPTLFNTCIDWINTQCYHPKSLQSNTSQYQVHNDFADDSANLSTALETLLAALVALK